MRSTLLAVMLQTAGTAHSSHWYENSQWYLVIVAGVTAGIICWQAVLTQRSVRTAAKTVAEVHSQTGILRQQASAASDNAAAAKQSAEIALKSINLLIAKERPWIRIAVEDFEPGEPYLSDDFGTDYWVSFKILCSCPTRAFIVSALAHAYIEGIDTPLGKPIHALPEIVNETATFATRTYLIFNGTNCLEKLKAGKLHFEARITYVGDSLTEANEPYETNVHLRACHYSPERHGFNALGIKQYYWVRCGLPEDNRET